MKRYNATEMEYVTSIVTEPDLEETTNGTTDPSNVCSRHLLGESGFLTFQISTVLLMAFICIVGNLLVIVLMTRGSKLSTPLNQFIVSLAVSDLIHGISYCLYNIGHVHADIIHNTLGVWNVCNTIIVLIISSSTASSFSLVGITVLRFMSIQWPLQHKFMLSKPRVTAAITLNWILAFILGAIFHARPVAPAQYCRVCLALIVMKPYQKAAHTIIANTLPAVIMIILYCIMAHIYRTHMKSMVSSMAQEQMSRRPQKVRHDRSLSCISAFLVIYFICSFIPMIVNYIVYTFWHTTFGGYLRSVVQLVYFSNTSVNFFAYIIAHHEFRRTFIQIFCHRRYLDKRRQSASWESRRSRTSVYALEDGGHGAASPQSNSAGQPKSIGMVSLEVSTKIKRKETSSHLNVDLVILDPAGKDTTVLSSHMMTSSSV